MIRLRNVTCTLSAVTVLNDVTLSLDERRVGVVGLNGSGKSTLLRTLNGLVRPTAGSVEVFGRDVAKETAAVRRDVGFVFQNPDHQIVMPIVEEDLAFGLKPLKLGRAETERRIGEALERYRLAHLRERPCHTLSGGEKQLLALSAVLASAPRLVVLDEPTTLLDLRNARLVIDALFALDQPIVVATHDLDLASRLDRIVVVDGGRIVGDGPPAATLDFYRSLAA